MPFAPFFHPVLGRPSALVEWYLRLVFLKFWCRLGYGTAPDEPQLVPAVKRITRRADRVPAAVTADRGYRQPAVEQDLHELGIQVVAIPRQAGHHLTIP